MRFIRVVLHALVCGFLFCLLLALLVLNLNINIPFRPGLLFRIALFLSLSYGLATTVLIVLLFFFIQFFASRRARLLFSPTFLTLGSAILVLFFLTVFWENYKYFLAFFDLTTRTLLRRQMLVLFALGLAGIVLTYAYHYYRKHAVFFLLYAALLAGGVIYAIGQRARFPQPAPAGPTMSLEIKRAQKRVILLGLEGLSLDFIIPRLPEGTLPNFSWLLDKGSWGRLENFSPNEPLVLNTSLDTGKLPFRHRRISPCRYRLLFCPVELEIVPRFMLFKQLTRVGLLTVAPADPRPIVKDIWQIFSDNRVTAYQMESPLPPGPDVEPAVEPAAASPRSDKSLALFFKDFETDRSPLFRVVRRAFDLDAAAEETAFEQKTRGQPQVFALRLNGLNAVETYFFKFSVPERYGNIAQEEITRYGSVIPRYYHYYDQVVGKYLAGLKDEDLLVVYSSHGIEPLPLWKRFVEWILGNPDVSADHESAPDGVVFFFGRGIIQRNTLERVRLVDLAPTVLYYLGLPVGRDMDGIVRSEIFSKEFTAENPIFYISSYEDILLTSEKGPARRP
jgi:hypothetical protein